MSDESRAALGRAIREARVAAGLSAQQLAARTRIRERVLADLEAGRTASSGAPVYVRGHLRAIASATGADPAPLLAAHERIEGGPEPLLTASVALPAVRTGALRLPAAPRPERRGPRWGAAGVLAVTVLAGLTIIGSLDDSGTAAPTPASSLAGEPAPSAAGGAPRRTEAPRRAVAEAPAPDGAALRLRVLRGSSWAEVRGSDRRVLFRGVLEDGEVRDFTDRRALQVTVGNAGVVGVICGREDVPAGRDGQVRQFTCRPRGLASR